MERWLIRYAKFAEQTDRFLGRPDQDHLIAAGLFGEAGSVLAEIKKRQREQKVYPAYLGGLAEELGDFLWYFVRLVSLRDRALLKDLALSKRPSSIADLPIHDALRLGAATGSIISALDARDHNALRPALLAAWDALRSIAAASGIALRDVADANLAKTQSRWPVEKAKEDWPRLRDFHTLFDENVPPEEQLPREFEVEFIERRRGARTEVVLRCNGISIGARINDNIADPDHYRYHDVFHLSYAVFTGWSPVIRNLFRCKRKSRPDIDENQDGARAAILEEAISAVVFSRAKHLRYFKDATQVDYDMLKNIAQFVRGYEVEVVPTWQWERAILEGFRAFRFLKANRGGRVSWSIPKRTLKYSPLEPEKKPRAARGQ